MGTASFVGLCRNSAVALASACFAVSMTLLSAQTCAYAAETPVAAEKNPPGDIPDNQVFIDYASSLGFTMKVPEGWARREMGDGVSFVDKLDGIVLTVTPAKAKPDLSWAKTTYVGELKASGRGVKIGSVKAEKLPSGEAIRIAYTSNSDPSPVTNRQVRLENERYLFYRDGTLVTLELYAPKGADNVDQWQLMSRSFAWK